MATLKKIFKVRRSAKEDIEYQVAASTYEELLTECKRKLDIGNDAEKLCLCRTNDNTVVDEELFPDIENYTTLSLYRATRVEYPPIVFRVQESDKTVFQIGERNILVHVNVSENYTKYMDGLIDSLKDDEELFSIDWSREEDQNREYVSGIKTMVTDKLKQNLDVLERTCIQVLGNDDYKVVRLLTEKFFVHYKAMLFAVFTGCLDLRFGFNSPDERKAMMDDIGGVQSLLSSVLLTPGIKEKFPTVYLEAKFKHRATSEINSRRKSTTSPDESSTERLERRLVLRESYSYLRDESELGTDLQNLQGGYLEGKSLENIFRLVKAFPGIEPPIYREDVLYTVVCVDKSSTQGFEEFNSVKNAAMQFFRDLDENIHDKLDENVAVLSFGSSINRISGFSFEIQNQMKYIDEMRQDVDSPSPDILIETVVAAGMILKQYGQIRHFRDLPSENLDPRIVLITGSEAVQSSTASRFLQTLKDKRASFPVYCLDVRGNEHSGFLSDVANITHGKLIQKEKKTLLGAFHRLKVKHNRLPSYTEHVDELQDIEFLFGESKKRL